MSCGDEKLSKCLTQTFTAHCNAVICQQVTLSGDAEWPKVADAVIEAFFTTEIIFVVSCRKKPVRAGVPKRKISLLRQAIATAVLLPRASMETNKNYSMEVRQQYP